MERKYKMSSVFLPPDDTRLVTICAHGRLRRFVFFELPLIFLVCCFIASLFFSLLVSHWNTLHISSHLYYHSRPRVRMIGERKDRNTQILEVD